jgi:methyl-accepting chemotaxis protein
MAIGRMVETVMQVTGDIVQSISTFNDTLNEINKVAHRVNALLDEIEGPVAEIVPLVQASAKQAKATLKKVDGVIDQVGTLPADVTQAVAMLGDLAGRLGPLAQFAEVAGGMFGMKPASN